MGRRRASPPVGVYDPARGDVPRRLSRLQGLARRRARGARGAAPRRPQRAAPERRRRRGDQHAAASRTRRSRRAARRPRARRARTGASTSRAAPRISRGDAFAGLPPNVTVVARRSEETAGVRRRRRRRDRLRPGRRAPRPRARVREDPGRLLVLVQLLRHPARARQRRAAAAPTPCSREIRRRVEQGHREVVLTGINLGCFRDRAAGYDLPRLVREAGATPGLERLRLSSIEINHVDDALVAALRETPTVAQAPPRAAPVRRRRRPARDAPPLHRRHLPAPARAARGRVQPDERRDRRLPGRGRRRVRAARSRTVERAGHHAACTSSRTRRGPAPSPRPTTPCPPR